MAAKKKKPVDVEQLLQQCLSVIQQELNKIEKNQVDALIDRQASMTLNEYTRTLISMKREVRQTNMEDDLDKLEDHELNALAQQAATYLKKN